MHSHIVTFQTRARIVGLVTQSFRTTADALPLHLAALRKRQAEGVTVRAINQTA